MHKEFLNEQHFVFVLYLFHFDHIINQTLFEFVSHDTHTVPNLGATTIFNTYHEITFYKYIKEQYGPHIQKELKTILRLMERRTIFFIMYISQILNQLF